MEKPSSSSHFQSYDTHHAISVFAVCRDSSSCAKLGGSAKFKDETKSAVVDADHRRASWPPHIAAWTQPRGKNA